MKPAHRVTANIMAEATKSQRSNGRWENERLKSQTCESDLKERKDEPFLSPALTAQ